MAPPRTTALLLLPAVLLAALGWERRWVNEDGFIYLRVVDNLVHGRGPVFNVGERVEAYTSPAWLGLMSSASALVPSVRLEWIAVVLGLALAVAGLVAATIGAHRHAGRPRSALPLGALVIAALPPYWDYATSGLETGLVFAWMGLAFWALSRLVAGHSAAPPRSGRRLALMAAGVGLGPLVRPDLAIFSVGFLAVLLALSGPPRARRWLGLLVAAGALPVAYQIFRMGYFAALVPNTALAKEAGLAYWTRGIAYLANFVLPYALFVPVGALLAWWARGLRADWRSGRRSQALVGAAPVACAAIHAVYVVRLGGDYMHARMFLPSLFGALLPVMVVGGGDRRWRVALALAVVPWSLLCAFALRAPVDGERFDRFPDQRRTQDLRAEQAGVPDRRRAVTLEDHRQLRWSQPDVGIRLREMAASGPAIVLRYLTDTRRAHGRDLPVSVPVAVPGVRPAGMAEGRVVAYTGSIGRAGLAAGPSVHLVDRLGLADPLAARLRLTEPRRRKVGHEKSLPPEWVLARFADPALPVAGDRAWRARVAAARAALACPATRELLAATSAPLTPARFARNVRKAARLHSLRFSEDVRLAARDLCRRPI